MIRRRRSAILARTQWRSGPTARLSALADSVVVQAIKTPRAARVIDLIELGPGRRYVDIGCGTASYARLLAERAGAPQPICLDIAPAAGIDAVAWPEHLPFDNRSIDSLTSLYFIRRFDDEVIHSFGGELSRVLAPGGCALILEVAPVAHDRLNHLHEKLLSPGAAAVDLRGWGRLAALFTECGFDAIDLVNVGPFFFPPIPRVGVLLRRASY